MIWQNKKKLCVFPCNFRIPPISQRWKKFHYSYECLEFKNIYSYFSIPPILRPYNYPCYCDFTALQHQSSKLPLHELPIPCYSKKPTLVYFVFSFTMHVLSTIIGLFYVKKKSAYYSKSTITSSLTCASSVLGLLFDIENNNYYLLLPYY